MIHFEIKRRMISLCCIGLFVISGSLQAQNTMKTHVINVGQGSATLLEFSCGVILVDVGGELNDQFSSRMAIDNYLDDFFARRTDLNLTIDLLILSHPHIDHTRSVSDIEEKYVIKNVITNGQESGSGRWGQIHIHRKVAEAEGTRTTNDDIGYWESQVTGIPDSGLTNNIIDPVNCPNGDPVITLLWGRVASDPGWGNDRKGRPNFSDANNHSVLIKVEFGQSSILLTGDLEEEAIESLLEKYQGTDILDVDVYLVGHHGSKNGSTVEMIQAMSPEIAVLSFGDSRREGMWTAWAHGHPNLSIIEMLQNGVSSTRQPSQVWIANGPKNFFPIQMTQAVYATGWEGDIILEATLNGQWTNLAEDPQNPTDNGINVNTATKSELETLPSIGSVKAQAIIDHRTTNDNFSTADDLDNVRGIGPATIARIRPLISF